MTVGLAVMLVMIVIVIVIVIAVPVLVRVLNTIEVFVDMQMGLVFVATLV